MSVKLEFPPLLRRDSEMIVLRKWLEKLHKEVTNINTTITVNLNSDTLDGYHFADIERFYLKLDQTTPQTVLNGTPVFSGGIDTPTINNNYNSNVDLFKDLTVADDADGKAFTIYRKATENGGHGYISFQIKNWEYAYIYIDKNEVTSPYMPLFFEGQLFLSFNSDFRLGDNSIGAGTNPYMNHYGYITAASSAKYVQWLVSDTDDKFHLTRQDANVLGFKCEIPFGLSNGAADINEFSTDGTMAGDSDVAVPTEKAVKTYVDTSHPTREITFDAASLQTLETAFASLEILSGTVVKTYVRAFDDTTQEYTNGKFQVPADILTTGTVTFRAYVMAKTAAASKYVQLSFDHSAKNDSEDYDTAYTTEDSGDKAIDATQDDVSEITWTETVSNLGWAANDYVNFRLSRKDTAAEADLVGDMYLHLFTIEIPRTT